MKNLFFDTSALVKRYHAEAGTERVDAAFDEEAVKIISDISIIEFYSAFARKVRIGEISREEFLAAVRELGEDVVSGVIRLEPFGDDEKIVAAELIEKHGMSSSLRTLDSMQMAVMKKAGPGFIYCVYCADRALVDMLRAEGFTVVNPEE